MDPFVAAGLAGNVVTFVDFSAKLLSRSQQLYASASGAVEENDELESLAKNLRDFAERIRQQPTGTSPTYHSSSDLDWETVLNNLAQQCIQVADQLLELLDSIKVKGDGRIRSSVQALKSLWKQEHIDSLQRRLERISKQLIDWMSMAHLEETNRRLREMAVDNTRLEANRTKEIDQLRRDFNSAIEVIKAKPGDEQAPEAWLMLSDVSRRGKEYFAEQVVLNCLKFSLMDSRLESIREEHSKTFSWIFDPTSSVKFVQWLKGKDGVYWVSGKPGSGKSTLMKFVAAHDETKRYLAQWAGDKQLIIANYFFWDASTQSLQKSQEGLLRTILYQILRQCPQLIHVAYDDQWVRMTSDGRILKDDAVGHLTVPALIRTLRKISTSTLSDTKFCFFIDGLDEYNGRPADIIKLIDILMSFPNVKACVSSRSWNDFEDRFGSGNDSPRKLYMQDLSRQDIQLYVEDTLGKHPRFKQLQSEDPHCPNFVHDVVWRANGVFLWVSLVTQSLYDGLTNSDRIKDLQARLDQTPGDLTDYFNKILFSTENLYRTQTAHWFTVATHAVKELPLMAYWVIDQENPKYVFQCPLEAVSNEALYARLQNSKRRLQVLSKGLLHVDVEPQEFYTTPAHLIFTNRVRFSHRTVEDYLKTPHTERMLQSWSRSAFNAHWEVCNALGALAIMSPPSILGSFGGSLLGPTIRDIFAPFAYHALFLDGDTSFRADMASLLERLQTKLAPHFKLQMTNSIFSRIYWSLVEGKTGFENELLVTYGAVFGGLRNFLAEKFEREPLLCRRISKGINALYWWVTETDGSYCYWHSKDSCMLMLELLLNHGADPNGRSDGVTEWRLIIERLLWYGFFERKARFDALALLLRHGADFEQQCDDEDGHPTKACHLLKTWFEPDQYAMLEDIVRRRETELKKRRAISRRIKNKLWMSSKR